MTAVGPLYYRPVVQGGLTPSKAAVPLTGGPLWFDHVEVLQRGAEPRLVPVTDVPAEDLKPLCAMRSAVQGLDVGSPLIMGILNVTPDSFSDGGRHEGSAAAVQAALRMIADGARIIDIGGESTRPGASFIDADIEIERTAPVIASLRSKAEVTISVDTRKASVAEAALKAGADWVNDVSGFTFDGALAPLCAQWLAPVCVMHAQGDPETMQNDPSYDDVLLDVYDYLHARIDALIAIGIPKTQIIADPGIGFGKTLDHNLALLNRISLFHGLGVPILLGASRKKFIGTIGGVAQADQRIAGSVSVALAAAAQGVQILRVHDVADTAQALRLWQAVRTGAL